MELHYNSQSQKIEKGGCYNPGVRTGWQTFVSISIQDLFVQMNLWRGLLRGFFLRLIQHQNRQDSNISPISEASTDNEIELPPLKPYDPDLSPYGDLPPIDRLDCIVENLRLSREFDKV